MDIKEYQNRALKLAIYKDKIIYPSLGLCGESGEVAEKVKKALRDNNGQFTEETKQELIKEIGDVMWYVVAILNDIGSDLESCMSINITKLESRAKRGVLTGNGDNR